MDDGIRRDSEYTEPSPDVSSDIGGTEQEPPTHADAPTDTSPEPGREATDEAQRVVEVAEDIEVENDDVPSESFEEVKDVETAGDSPEAESTANAPIQDGEDEKSDNSDNLSDPSESMKEDGSDDTTIEDTASKKGKGKVIGIAIAICGAAVAAVLCLIFLVIIPSQQQAAFEAAQNSMAQYDFEGAIANLQDAGDSDDAQELLKKAQLAEDYQDTLNESFNEEGITNGNKDAASIAVGWIKAYFPDYPEIESYETYLDAVDAEGHTYLYEAFSKYDSLGDFLDASDKANALNTKIEQYYNEGNDALANKDWEKAKSSFEHIAGYKDASDKYEQAESEIEIDTLASNLDNTVWKNENYVMGYLFHMYYLQFSADKDSDGLREGTAYIILQSSNTLEYVGSYRYTVISKDTIHMKGTYNNDGRPPLTDFDQDVKARFTTSATSKLTLTPTPVSGNFKTRTWTYAGEANVLIASMGATGESNGGYFSSNG